jgi:hypothetical protein
MEKIENALLATMLSDGDWGDDVQVTRLNLPSGPLQEEHGEWVYFPVDALISWVPTHSMQGAVALVAHRGCVLLPPAQSAPVQLHVVSPGHAYRLDWTLVRQNPSRFASGFGTPHRPRKASSVKWHSGHFVRSTTAPRNAWPVGCCMAWRRLPSLSCC